MAIIGITAGIMPFMRTTYVQQPKLIQQPEERQKVDLMALIQEVSGIGKRGASLAESIIMHRATTVYQKVYYRVSSGWVIKVFLRKRNGRSRVSK